MEKQPPLNVKKIGDRFMKDTPFAIRIYHDRDSMPDDSDDVVIYKGALNLEYCEEDSDGPLFARAIQDYHRIKKDIREMKKAGYDFEQGSRVPPMFIPSIPREQVIYWSDVVVSWIHDFWAGTDEIFRNREGKNPYNIFCDEDENSSIYVFVPDSKLDKFVKKNRKIMPPLVRESDKEDPDEYRDALPVESSDKEDFEWKEELISPRKKKIVDWEVRRGGGVTVHRPVYAKEKN